MGDKHNNRRKEELRKAKQAAEKTQQGKESTLNPGAQPSQGNREEMNKGRREQ
ncbi:MAG TPA: hypothetical protein VKR06_14620 [Ktedonosporobacter sp.]|nr:hypothetical protein [Ktedonosporobacter sp.]